MAKEYKVHHSSNFKSCDESYMRICRSIVASCLSAFSVQKLSKSKNVARVWLDQSRILAMYGLKPTRKNIKLFSSALADVARLTLSTDYPCTCDDEGQLDTLDLFYGVCFHDDKHGCPFIEFSHRFTELKDDDLAECVRILIDFAWPVNDNTL